MTGTRPSPTSSRNESAAGSAGCIPTITSMSRSSANRQTAGGTAVVGGGAGPSRAAGPASLAQRDRA